MSDAENCSATIEMSVEAAAVRRTPAIAYATDDLTFGLSLVMARLDRCRRAAAHAGFEILDNLQFYDGVVGGVRRSQGRRKMWAAVKKHGIKHVYCCEKDLTFQRCRTVQALMKKPGVTVHWLGDTLNPLQAEFDALRQELESSSAQ